MQCINLCTVCFQCLPAPLRTLRAQSMPSAITYLPQRGFGWGEAEGVYKEIALQQKYHQ